MSISRLILRTLRHYPWSSAATAAGIAIATAIICGALIIGYSLTQSLQQIVYNRLGNTSHTLTAGDRLFTAPLAYNINQGISAAPVLKSEAIITLQGSDRRINKVQVWGVDSAFARVTGSGFDVNILEQGSIALSENLAAALQVNPGDYVLLRIRTINPIPANTPFISEEGQTVSRRVKIAKVLNQHQGGHFNLQASQSTPYNIFISLQWLNDLMNLEDKANLILINTPSGNSDLHQLVRDNITLEDLGLELEPLSSINQVKLTSERVFMDEYISSQILSHFPESKPHLTYFANSLQHQENITPYSFVTSLENTTILQQPDDMIINQWLAEDLNLKKGDSLLMRFYVVGPLRELEETEHVFTIRDILSMEVAEIDHVLMPHLPGLSDAGSCRDWDTGIPIDLESIRDKDEKYWDDYRGTPKAYISLARGQELWQNRFGNLTTILFPSLNSDDLAKNLTAVIDPFQMGFKISPVKEEGLMAAKGGVDFGQLFGGLGFFVIVSGLMLTVLLLQFSLQKRRSQINLYASMGFSERLIHRIVMSEALIIVISGALAGLVLSVFYTQMVFNGLNRIWYDIVRTDVLEISWHPALLLAGFLISVVLGIFVVFFATRKTIRKSLSHKTQPLHPGKSKSSQYWLPAAIIFSSLSIVTIFIAIMGDDGSGLLKWFSAGMMLLITFLLWVRHALYFLARPGKDNSFNPALLSWKNLTRNPVRSFTIIVLLALGSFAVVLTAANQKDLTIDSSDPNGGTGGFTFMAETTAPFLRNLNLPETREDLGISADMTIVQFLTTHDDDASCHNLNRVANPRILAVKPDLLSGRFSFATTHPLVDNQNPWSALELDIPDVIPAFADQNVIQWGLGKKTGDTLFYINARGEQIKLLLMGGLQNSVLQGNVIISQDQFLRHFPSADGTGVFLLQTSGTNDSISAEELNNIFRDYGWEMNATPALLASFNSVENTYLQIFFLMGALGMLLGTIGLAVVVARSLIERRQENNMLNAMGFPGNMILRIYFTEYTTLLIAGIAAGSISAFVATLPSWLAGLQNINPWFLPAVILLIIINGLAWNYAIPAVMLRSSNTPQALEN